MRFAVEMKKRRPVFEIAAKLRRAERMLAEGKSEAEIARALNMSLRAFHRWRASVRTSAATSLRRINATGIGDRSGEADERERLQTEAAQYLVDKGEELLQLGRTLGLAAETLIVLGHELMTKAVELETRRQRKPRR